MGNIVPHFKFGEPERELSVCLLHHLKGTPLDYQISALVAIEN